MDKIVVKKVSPLLQGERYNGSDFYVLCFSFKEMVLLDYSVLEQLQILIIEVYG
jgi:hypothetical protein